MVDRPDNARLAIFGSFLRAHQQVAEALNKSLMDERGISLSWYDVLLQLSTATDGRLRLQDLADKVLYSRSGLTRLIDRMEKAGLVMRQPCSHDKRGTWAVMTDKGWHEFRRAAPTHLRGIESEFFSRLTDEEARSVGKAMRRIIRTVEAPAPEPVATP